MVGGETAVHREIGQDRRSAQTAVEDCSGCFQLDPLVRAIQQLAEALYGARRQFAQPGLDHLRHTGPAAGIGTATGQPVSVAGAFRHEASSIAGALIVNAAGGRRSGRA